MRIVIAAVIALVIFLSAAHAGDTGMYVSELSNFNKELLSQINHYRVSQGLKSLTFDNNLAGLAQSHCSDMKRRGVLCHDNFEQRFKKSGHTSCVENVGWNYRTAKELFIAWKNSDHHDRNMRAENIKRAGISMSGTYVTFFACN